MPELTSDRSTATTYRPVSLLAIVGCILGLISLLVFVFDQFLFLLFFALPGLVTSVMARRRIARSEGTLAGSMVAAVGITLSLAGGLGYLTYYYVTYFTIRAESKAFVDRWLKFTRDGEEIAAFLATVEPGNRPAPGEELDMRSIRARYPQGKSFDSFRNALLSSMALRYGNKAQWTWLGIRDYRWVGDSYHVKHRFHFSSPETDMEVLLLTTSENVVTPRGRRREWMVEMGGCEIVAPTMQVTPYGVELRDAYKDAFTNLQGWLGLISQGRVTDAYQALIDPDARKRAHFDELVAALREGVKDEAPSQLRLSQLLQLHDEKEDRHFILDLRAIVEHGPIDVEFDVRMESPDYHNGPPSWKLKDLTLLGLRKRHNPADAIQGPPRPQPPSRLP